MLLRPLPVKDAEQLTELAYQQKNGPLLNWGCISWAVLGILVQLLLERRQRARARAAADKLRNPVFAPPPHPSRSTRCGINGASAGGIG